MKPPRKYKARAPGFRKKTSDIKTLVRKRAIMAHLSMYLPYELYMSLRADAEESGTNMSELIRRALRVYLSMPEQTRHRTLLKTTKHDDAKRNRQCAQ
jgi:hypothetical protein